LLLFYFHVFSAGRSRLHSCPTQREWTFAEGAVTFAKSASNSLDIPSAQVIDDMLAYANELERIV
jgi:hypothetical protein